MLVYQIARSGSKIVRNKMIGAQICNLEKSHTITVQGQLDNHWVICEFSGTVLDVVTNDKFLEKAME